MLLDKKIIMPAKYLNFINILSKKLAIELPKYFNINKHLINLKFDKLLSYKLIYNLKLVELKIFEICIKTSLINS